MTAPGFVEASPDGATLPIGSYGPPFEDLLGVDGLRHGFSSLADRRALVLIFSSNRCPTAKAYAERMNALQRDYGPLGVQVVALNANDPHLYPEESYPRMIERATEDGWAKGLVRRDTAMFRKHLARGFVFEQRPVKRVAFGWRGRFAAERRTQATGVARETRNLFMSRRSEEQAHEALAWIYDGC